MNRTLATVALAMPLSLLQAPMSTGEPSQAPRTDPAEVARLERELAGVEDAVRAAAVPTGRRFDGKYVLPGSTHAYTRHELVHVLQQRARSAEETAGKVLVAVERGGSAEDRAGATELRDAVAALRAAADRLAASREAKAEAALLDQVRLANERTRSACRRVNKIEALTVKQK